MTPATLTDAGRLLVVDPTRLTPRCAAAGYVPVTDLPWLEELRQRHEQLAARVAAATRVVAQVQRRHDEEVAGWCAEVRATARAGVEPPAWHARLSVSWLDGCMDRAEEDIAAAVDDILAVLREADAACDEAGIDALVEPVDDGFGGALVAMSRNVEEDAALPAWAGAVRDWRQWRRERVQELEGYTNRRRELRGEHEDR